jgi:hypothetical protein
MQIDRLPRIMLPPFNYVVEIPTRSRVIECGVHQLVLDLPCVGHEGGVGMTHEGLADEVRAVV